MRPEILFPLFRPVDSLPGVGPRISKLIARLAGEHVADLLWLLPSGIIDRRYSPSLADARPGSVATLSVTVEQHLPGHNPRQPYKVACSDPSGTITLVFFHAKRDYLERVLPVGANRVVSGKVELFAGALQMGHPDHIGTPDEIEAIKTVEPTYPLTAGLTPKPLAKAIGAAVEAAPELEEWLDPAYLAQQGWPGWHEAIRAAHAPKGEAELDPRSPARARLAYDELLANQLALALVRAAMGRRPGRALEGDGRMRARVLAALPYSLTGSQEAALVEIAADLRAETRMLRLLQGDVGSGKTVVALLTMLIAVEAGAQAALMAPTEVLARQHHAVLAPLAAAAGVRLVLLTGREKGKAREQILADLAGGQVDMLVGTHALFQEDVQFNDLALAVIDEQHRFGVHQRLTLGAKGGGRGGAHVLVMTATPIPRTLTLTAYGDMDVSRLLEKPAGRKPVATRAVPIDRLEEVIAAVGRAVSAGGRIYWICPLVEQSESGDLAAAEARHRDLGERFGAAVGLVHGRMKGAEKDAAMAAFADGERQILVATTVVEVGVDVPEANVMVIEHAERFGLAQLHQLRGRVGRGEAQSSCLLLYAGPLGTAARARLNIMRETEDGFRIAEEDLRLRGAGEILGTRQSGMPEFRIADLEAHAEFLEVARDDARLVLTRDADLESPRGKSLRVLLYLFERDAAVKFLRSG